MNYEMQDKVVDMTAINTLNIYVEEFTFDLSPDIRNHFIFILADVSAPGWVLYKFCV